MHHHSKSFAGPFVASVLALAGAVFLLSATAHAQDHEAVEQVTQRGITFKFDKAYPHGRFANGDFWVVAADGKLTITEITPAFDGKHHGWEANADSYTKHGYDARANGFDASRVPELPYVASPGESIVKTVSVDPSVTGRAARPALLKAAVLTVLDAPPPEGGRTTFRPPYFGHDKPLYSTNDLQPEKLPRVAAPGEHTPTLERIADRFQPVWLDDKENWGGRRIHPRQHMPAYGSGICAASGEAVLRLMLDDPPEAKMQALINYVQWGIDLYHMRKAGMAWPANGGHMHGRKLAIAFAGVMLDDREMIEAAALPRFDDLDRRWRANIYHEDSSVYYSPVAKRVLWGQPQPEAHYWLRICENRGSKTTRDPYGYIDGGTKPGSSYQYCCNSMTWKGTALALQLMPSLRRAWNYEPFLDYVDRWVTFGAWAQPDPYALDCENPGSKDTDETDGIGRFPNAHGTNANQGSWDSNFANAMWAKHRPDAAVAMPHIAPYGARSVESITVTLASPHTEGATIHYTLDGSEPTTDSPRYDEPFELTESTLVRARAFKDGLYDSAINQAPFVLGADAADDGAQ